MMSIKTISNTTRNAVGTIRRFPQCILFSLVLFLIFFACVPIQVVAETYVSILRRSNYPESQQEAIRNEIEEAIKEGIPEELLIPRLEEGIAKRASGAKVLNVLEGNIQRLKEARRILMAVGVGNELLKDRGAWARTANLLAKGISQEEITQIAAFSRNRWKDYRDATYLFVSLVQWGLPREKALKLTTSVLQSSIRGKDFAGVVDLLIDGRRFHISPEELAGRIIEKLPLVKTFEELEEKVLYR